MKPSKLPNPQPQAGLFTLEVFLISNAYRTKVTKRKPIVSRTIQIRGDQTLEVLHEAIFNAYDRFDEHLYEFQFGKRPMDPKARRYVLSVFDEGEFATNRARGHVETTTIESLDLKVGQAFYYWFDFGDDWWHQINVEGVDENVPKEKYPKLVKQVGESPPQYPEEEDEEGDEEEDDDE